jgi:hypothetical protein
LSHSASPIDHIFENRKVMVKTQASV